MKEKAKEMILEVEKIEEEFKNNEINFDVYPFFGEFILQIS